MSRMPEDLFLPASAEPVAGQALQNLQSAHSTAQAVEIAIAMEDTIRDMQASQQLSDSQARRLYLLFEMALETRLRSLGRIDSTPRLFP